MDRYPNQRSLGDRFVGFGAKALIAIGAAVALYPAGATAYSTYQVQYGHMPVERALGSETPEQFQEQGYDVIAIGSLVALMGAATERVRNS